MEIRTANEPTRRPAVMFHRSNWDTDPGDDERDVDNPPRHTD